MNLLISKSSTPEGTRFLYRNSNGNLEEGTIREWSYSGDYLNFNGRWITSQAVQELIIVEKLTDDIVWRKY